MSKFIALSYLVVSLFLSSAVLAQTDSIVLKDINWDKSSPAGMTELFIPSGNVLLAGFIYKANGAQKHLPYYYYTAIRVTSGIWTSHRS